MNLYKKLAKERIVVNKAGLIEKISAQNLETLKQDKRIPKYLSLDDSRKLLEVATDIKGKSP